MEIGLKIKNLRQLKNLTQEELADRCELTKGYISQLENDLTSTSIETLKDLLNALGTTFGEFFDESDDNQIVFKKDEYIEKTTDATTIKWLVPSAQKNSMEPIIIDINENCQTEKDMPHEGEEFGFVLNGKLELVVGKKTYPVKAHETFYFVANKPHYIKNVGKTPAKVIWVSNPPNF